MKNIITTKMTHFNLEKSSHGRKFLYTILHPFLDGPVHLFWSDFLNYFSSTSSQYSNVHVHSPSLEQNQVPSPERTDNTHQQLIKQSSFLNKLCWSYRHKTWFWANITNNEAQALESTGIHILVNRIWAAALCSAEHLIKKLYSHRVHHRHNFLLKILVYTLWKQKMTKLLFFVHVGFLNKWYASREMQAHTKQNRRKICSELQFDAPSWILGLIYKLAEQPTKEKQGGSHL